MSAAARSNYTESKFSLFYFFKFFFKKQLCVSTSMFVHLQFVTVHIQKPWVSGEFVGNYTLLWNPSFWAGSAAHFHTSTQPSPPLLVTHLLWDYMLPKSHIDPVLETPFHFSFLSETWSNGLLTLHMVSSLIHVQAQYLSAFYDLRQWVQLWQAWCPTELHCQNAFSCPALHVPHGVNPF